MVKVTLKGGVIREYEDNITVAQVAKSLGIRLYKAACAGKIDGKLCDLRDRISKDCELQILTFDDKQGRQAYWHTSSHIMAQAVLRLYPNAKLAIGPPVDDGFYYDFDLEEKISAEDLSKIEQEMKKIIKENLPIQRLVLTEDKAIDMMRSLGQNYKVELIKEHAAKGEGISLYHQGEFTDICAGQHLMSTGMLKAVKLTSCTGAYWRGSSDNKMLTRIYGVSFPKLSMLEEHLRALEDAKKRDHNKLGRDLGYFTTVDYIGQGLPILLENGSKVIQILQRFVEDEEERRGYILTKTPLLAKSDLYKISGHWDHYRESMFVLGCNSDDNKETFALRPMTCPFQFQVYLNKPRSYRDLPMRFNETATLFRNEASGEMHGLIRLRQFTISEGHIACTPAQLEREFEGCVDLANFILKTLGIDKDVFYRFSKWDEDNKDKYIGDPQMWEQVQKRMKEILDDIGIEYEEVEGDAAFYGPKLDIQMKNVHGKEDTLITVQIDFQLAERFGMVYIDENGEKQFPYILHRTSLGCYERTLALLIEKYAGALPLWLMPEQVRILPISDKYITQAQALLMELRNAGIRARIDNRSEKTGYKIRSAQLEKIPYMLILGEKELESETISVRSRKQGDLGSMKRKDLETKILGEIESKTTEV